jgi:hypothetical protein
MKYYSTRKRNELLKHGRTSQNSMLKEATPKDYLQNNAIHRKSQERQTNAK